MVEQPRLADAWWQDERGTWRQGPARPPVRLSRLERVAGFALFLVVTVCWSVGIVSSPDYVVGGVDVYAVVWVLSVVSLVATGYLLGRVVDALWVMWAPGAGIIVAGIWMSHTPPANDGAGATTYLLGPAVLLFGWVVFLPLVGLGVLARRWLQERRFPN